MQRQPVGAGPVAIRVGGLSCVAPPAIPAAPLVPRRSDAPTIARCAPNRKPPPIAPITPILALADWLGDRCAAGRVPDGTILRFRNDRWARAVGLGELTDARVGARISARFEPLPDNLPQPLALRYHGHQFRVYNPEIGDGRGFTFAQLRDGAGRLLDLGTKGSGLTPYSRTADGRLTLKGAVREILATEMLEALGRLHLEDLLGDRDRRGARARRRALADPLGGAGAAQPRKARWCFMVHSPTAPAALSAVRFDRSPRG